MGADAAGVDIACGRIVRPVLEAVLSPGSPATGLGPRLGLIWGYDFVDGNANPIEHAAPGLSLDDRPAGGFRWLHLNLADQWTHRWFAATDSLPAMVRELMLSPERHQRVFIEADCVAMIVHDFEREFDGAAMTRMGSLTVLLQPGSIVTARQHPVCAADIVHERIAAGARPATAAAALDLLFTAIAAVGNRVTSELLATVQAAEDALLDDGRDPDARELVGVRKRSIQLHRQMTGLRTVLHRLETDDDLPPDLEPTVSRLAQRMTALDSDIIAVQGNLRLLREELEIQTATRTGQNLYLLSILSALLLPATLVTGIFGMNTGGLPWTTSTSGSFAAIGLVAASSALVYLWLRARGFFQR